MSASSSSSRSSLHPTTVSDIERYYGKGKPDEARFKKNAGKIAEAQRVVSEVVDLAKKELAKSPRATITPSAWVTPDKKTQVKWINTEFEARKWNIKCSDPQYAAPAADNPEVFMANSVEVFQTSGAEGEVKAASGAGVPE